MCHFDCDSTKSTRYIKCKTIIAVYVYDTRTLYDLKCSIDSDASQQLLLTKQAVRVH